VRKEQARFEEATAGFQSELHVLRIALIKAAGNPIPIEVTEQIDHIVSTLSDMIYKTNLIFDDFRMGRTRSAGSRMASMDRSYSEFLGSINRLREWSKPFTTISLLEQRDQEELLKKLEFAIACFVLLMLTGITLYGHKLAQASEAEISARVRAEESLRRSTRTSRRESESGHESFAPSGSSSIPSWTTSRTASSPTITTVKVS